MQRTHEIIYKNIDDLIPYVNNSRVHDETQVNQIASSIKEFGFTNPVLIDESNEIIAGHGRILAARKLKLKNIPCIVLDGLTKAQKKAYVIADNKIALNSGWDDELLKVELETLKDLDFDLTLTGFSDDELDLLLNDFEIEDGLTDEDHVPDVDEDRTPVTKLGDIWILGEHRLMCGDSTVIDDVNKLMQGEMADLAHNDPPYGMKKESDGIINDNLNFDDLLQFNHDWITLQFSSVLKDNGSWYCWGIDEPLMDIYSNIIKPLIKTQKATFRNLITWNKGNGQGQMSEEFRSYSIADEKCLFVMCGVQGFNNNADNYFDGWNSIVEYLKTEKEKAGLTIKDCKRIAGHSENSGSHWFDKSQWIMPTRETYNLWREYCKTKNNDAFKKEYDELKKEYDELKKEYDELKKEYDELKKEYYSTRAYFDNTHDNMNNVWDIGRTTGLEREQTGGHATPKPLELCQRVIKSSCPQQGLVVDAFLGSGSTLIAAEQTDRRCYGIELQEKYCDVIVKRWQNYTGKEAILETTKETFNELEAKQCNAQT